MGVHGPVERDGGLVVELHAVVRDRDAFDDAVGAVHAHTVAGFRGRVGGQGGETSPGAGFVAGRAPIRRSRAR